MEVEKIKVAIVGAGPAGLVLGLSLAQHGIKSIILDKEPAITEDPRGVYLASDAVRILYALGLGKYMSTIGHELHQVQFHQSTFAQAPFYSMDLMHDNLHQAVPNGVLQIQPELEKALRTEIDASEHCELRTHSEVLQVEEAGEGKNELLVQYRDATGAIKQLQSEWLIGADGKRGVVRKQYLEKKADIRQVEAAYKYQGTWIAANLHIDIPTPETHPEFPLWRFGMKPQEVYDLFWPKGWHFCSPPGKPTATGRFGPFEARMWRHELRQDDWDDEMNAEELFWEHITPMITRNTGSNGTLFPNGEKVTYPRDCIQILRCRPFNFSHKIVNRWFHGRTILIGDAAHVFPPFGGQGIASGIRDAHQLAWRLALLTGTPNLTQSLSNNILDAWARERTAGVADAASLTRNNGMLCNEGSWLLVWLLSFMSWISKTYMGGKPLWDPQIGVEWTGYRGASRGFFLSDFGGGRRIPQIYVDTLFDKRMLSDQLLVGSGPAFKIFILVANDSERVYKSSDVEAELIQAQVPASILSAESIGYISLKPARPDSLGHFSENLTHKASPTSLTLIPQRLARPGYDTEAWKERLGHKTRFVILRPDFYVFAAAANLTELRTCLDGLRTMCEGKL